MEAELRYNCYLGFLKRNVEDVREERVERGLSCNDLPKEEVDEEKEVEMEVESETKMDESKNELKS